MIGPPAVGKTTSVEGWIKNGHIAPESNVDPDFFREFLYSGGPRSQSGEIALWAWIDEVLRSRASRHLGLVLSASCVEVWQLDRRLAAVRGAEVGILRLSDDLEMLLDRDARRARSVGPRYLQAAFASFEAEVTVEMLRERVGDLMFLDRSIALKWFQGGE